MSSFVLQWKIDSANEGKLVREFLQEKQLSKRAVTDIKFKGGRITVNHQEVTVRYPLRAGDVLIVQFPLEEPSEGVKAEELPLDVIYEDEYLLVVMKPAGMNTIPSREHPHGSLASALLSYYAQIGLQAAIHIVTRLDRDTSGLVLVAKHRHIHHLLSEQQRSGLVKRIYEAFAHGRFLEQKGRIEAPIGRKSDSIIERIVREDGQFAATNYSVINAYPRFTHLELQLETGRTHQIRVHLSHIGHPLLGDDLYGGQLNWIARQALHCRKISFLHPFQEKKVEFTADLPEDMKKLLPAE